MPKRLIYAIVCFHISAALHALVGLFLILFAVVVELVVKGLNVRKYRAWIAGLVLCGIQILGGLNGRLLTLVLGGLALWGLPDSEIGPGFRVTIRRSPPNTRIRSR